MENVLPAKYEEAREEEKLRNKPVDLSDMVVEHVQQNSRKRKLHDKEGKKKKDFKF